MCTYSTWLFPQVVPTLEKMLPSEAFISVPPLEREDISDIISSWLANQKRALQSDQRKLLEVNVHIE